MEPKEHKKRTPVPGMGSLDVVDISNTNIGGDEFLEDGDIAFLDNEASDKEIQQLRIKALKQAIDMAKLMSNVTTDDILNMANIVLKYIQETEI